MLTDTTFWIDLLREHNHLQPGPASRFLSRHRAHQLSVSIVTWGELAAGVERIDDMNHVLHRVSIRFLPLHVAWTASRIERGMRGHRLGENDNWIAATALAFGLSLVTRDEGFRRVPRLRIVSY